MTSSIPEFVKSPPYDNLCNEKGNAGDEPNLLVDGRAKLRISHVNDLVVNGPLSTFEYTRAYCSYSSFNGIVAEEDRDIVLEFLRAV